jgi:hypothetical protein
MGGKYNYSTLKKDKNKYSLNYTYQDIPPNIYANWSLFSDLKHPVNMMKIGVVMAGY